MGNFVHIVFFFSKLFFWISFDKSVGQFCHISNLPYDKNIFQSDNVRCPTAIWTTYRSLIFINCSWKLQKEPKNVMHKRQSCHYKEPIN